MKQFNTIILACFLVCAGCQPPAQKPVWEQIKFKELAPARHSQADKTVEAMLQFNVYIFSIPAGNFDEARNIWTNLSIKPINFNGGNLFGENGFTARFGQAAGWQPVGKKLRELDSKNQRTVDLIMQDNGTDYVSLRQIDAEKNIFYKAQENQISGVTLGPGEAMLRLSAATVPDMRGVCKLTVEPTFKSNAKPGSLSAKIANIDELAFNAVSFTTKMSPGDFVLLGPANSVSRDMALGGVFFLSQDQSVVQIYLIVCTGVNN